MKCSKCEIEEAHICMACHCESVLRSKNSHTKEQINTAYNTSSPKLPDIEEVLNGIQFPNIAETNTDGFFEGARAAYFFIAGKIGR